MAPGAAHRAARLLGLALVLSLVGAWLAAAPAAEAVRHLCINHRSQASAQAAYRADPSLQPTLDPGRTGIACPNLPGPFDRVPVRAPAARAPVPAPAPAAPAPARPGAVRLPRTGGAGGADPGPLGPLGAIGGVALAAVALGARVRVASRRAR